MKNTIATSRPPTAKDVADHAGVSTATVSRYYSEPKKIRPATAARIATAIKDLSYVPDLNARALASRKAQIIGAVVPTLQNAIFAEGMDAMQRYLNRHNTTLIIASHGYDPEQEYLQVQRLIAHGISGLMLIGANRLDKTREIVAQRNLPYCLSWCQRDGISEPQIGFDNFGAAYAMGREILRLGHTRLGVLSGVVDWNDRAEDRTAGFLKCMTDAGYPISSDRILETPYDLDKAADAFELVLGADSLITCVFCGNDVIAAAAQKRARQMGLSVPDDISITGFDDIAMASALSPELTTIHVPHRQMGEMVAKGLLDAIDSNEPVVSRKIPYLIKRRESLTALNPRQQ